MEFFKKKNSFMFADIRVMAAMQHTDIHVPPSVRTNNVYASGRRTLDPPFPEG
jgi:hypothetical protein